MIESSPRPIHRSRKLPLAVLSGLMILGLSLAFASLTRAAATETVTNLDDSGSGSLRQAVTDVDDGGTIKFAASLKGTILLNSEIAIDKSVTIDGNDQVAVNGRAEYQVFVLGETTPGIDIEMNDLEITRGYESSEDGCGIHSEITGSLTLERMYFFRNLGSCDGGGVKQEGSGPVTVDESAFLRNSTENGGGGIMIAGDADLTVSDSEFALNAGDDEGGAIYTNGDTGAGTVTITDSLFDRNTAGADGDGGHIHHSSQAGDLTIERSLFLLGAAIDEYGGAIRVDDPADTSVVLFEDVEVFGSSAEDAGGMEFRDWYGDVTLRRVVVDSTFGGEAAAGVRFQGSPDFAGLEVLIEDSAVINNMGGDGNSPLDLNAGNSNYVIRNSTVAGNVGDGDEGGVNFQSRGGTLLIDGSSIVGNQTSSNSTGGGGLTIRDGAATVRNTIIADNLNGGRPNKSDCAEPVDESGEGATPTITLEGANLIGNPGECTFEAGSTTPITGDAGLAAEPVEVPNASGDGTTWVTPLLSDSPAIDAAVDSDLDFDQRGVARPQLQAADIGAYEFAPGPTIALVGKAGLTSARAKVSCGNQQACTVRVQGIRDLPARTDDPKTKARTISIAKGATKTVMLTYTKYMQNSIYRSLRKGRKAKFDLVAKNTQSGSASSKTVRVKVKVKPRKDKRHPINP